MNAVKGTVRGGRVEFELPSTLPDGTQVWIEPAVENDGFIREEDWPTTPKGIEELIRHLEQLEPVILTPDEEREIAAARKASREISIAAVRKQMGLET